MTHTTVFSLQRWSRHKQGDTLQMVSFVLEIKHAACACRRVLGTQGGWRTMSSTPAIHTIRLKKKIHFHLVLVWEKVFCRGFRRTTEGYGTSVGCPLWTHNVSPVGSTSLHRDCGSCPQHSTLAPAPHGKPSDQGKEDGNTVPDPVLSFFFTLFFMQRSIKHILPATAVGGRHDP